MAALVVLSVFSIVPLLLCEDENSDKSLSFYNCSRFFQVTDSLERCVRFHGAGSCRGGLTEPFHVQTHA